MFNRKRHFTTADIEEKFVKYQNLWETTCYISGGVINIVDLASLLLMCQIIKQQIINLSNNKFERFIAEIMHRRANATEGFTCNSG